MSVKQLASAYSLLPLLISISAIDSDNEDSIIVVSKHLSACNQETPVCSQMLLSCTIFQTLFRAMEHPLAHIVSMWLKERCIPKIRILDFFFFQEAKYFTCVSITPGHL